MVPWRWWYRLDARCLVRPHQQHGTRGVVDDEASGGAQAVRTETRTITVASHNQELYPLCYCADDLALYPPPTMNKLRILPSEPRCRGLQDLQGLLVCNLLEMSGGSAHPKGPTEQSGGCRFGDLADIGGRDVEERDPRVGGKDPGGGIEAPLPCPLDQPDNGLHRAQSSHQSQ